VDSSAYFALSDRSSINHERAARVQVGLTRERRLLFTTNFVIAETHALVLSRLGRDIAASTLGWIQESAATIVRVSERDELRAREIIATHTDKDYSYTDATSFAVMERLRIGEAFTFDRHFAQFGFAVLG
jgi:predicted nucleic acid-binding protein